MKVKLVSVTPRPQEVIEQAARTCYLSWDRMGSSDSGSFIRRLIRAGHLSVLEHASASFRFQGVSRALTHQLVRHRLFSFSQQSQRYVNEEEFDYVIPPSIEENPEMLDRFKKAMEDLSGLYRDMISKGVKREDARYVLPNSCCSEIFFTGNFRQFRHAIKLRGSRKAQWEIRGAFIRVLEILKKEAPDCFFDMTGDKRNNRVVIKEEE